MRLWHYKLIPVLPRQQLIAQWRELWAILGNIKLYGNPHHILVNKIMNYSFIHLCHYAELVYEEMVRRGYKVNKPIGKFRDIVVEVYPDIATKEDCKGGVFKGWHNYRYFVQCYYNLEEKYDCGGITDKEWDKIQKVADNMIKKELVL